MSHPSADSIEDLPEFVWTIIVAGGSGLRFGSRKQFADLVGRSVLQRSVDAAATVSQGIVIVVPADTVLEVDVTSKTDLSVVAGGETRAESVRCGIAAVPHSANVLLVHDAARPLATPELFDRVVNAVGNGAKAAIPTVAVADTIRHVDGGVIDRNQLLAVQTPQGFDAATLREAHASEGEATDDATLVEAGGHLVETIEGEPENRKLTEPADLVIATALIEHRVDPTRKAMS